MSSTHFSGLFLACRPKRQAQDVLRQLTHSLTFLTEVIFFFLPASAGKAGKHVTSGVVVVVLLG